MDSRELKFIKWFNEQNNTNFVKVEDQFSRYDFYNDNWILELKIRNLTYDEKFLQADKGLSLVQIAQSLGKKAMYAVADKKAVYLYNLSSIDFRDKKLSYLDAPVTTDFKDKKYIKKYFYTLTDDEAFKIIGYKKEYEKEKDATKT